MECCRLNVWQASGTHSGKVKRQVTKKKKKKDIHVYNPLRFIFCKLLLYMFDFPLKTLAQTYKLAQQMDRQIKKSGEAEVLFCAPWLWATCHVMLSCDRVCSSERIMELQVISKLTDPQNTHTLANRLKRTVPLTQEHTRHPVHLMHFYFSGIK